MLFQHVFENYKVLKIILDMSHLSVEILYESKEKNLFCSYQLLFLLYQYEKIKGYQL